MFEAGEIPDKIHPYYYMIYTSSLPPALTYRIVPNISERRVADKNGIKKKENRREYSRGWDNHT